ncbi:hypothetical protein GMORB2_5296 [Geosmithia morbida]|uniref:BZIP domain-containing protein n=1 Tax=Geosmithia morbida TaxID=1094350 RepID=A0A9P4YZ06_9HYPO|nr:uncharacterized protein GMORB2_5296 [Geosmithia morbida]KAF4124630.1 hypothetical protein GMORB2_5296 [Geosmithia morbida]
MEFTGQYQFAAGNAPYHQFLPVPPLTPSHSQSAPSDECNNNSSPATEHGNGHDRSEPDDQSNSGRGGSEEGPLTPAQSKRKAQNRAAQRAFRERKEKHVKDLENKLSDLEAARKAATTENERLRADLAKMATENELLKATAGMYSNTSSSSHPSSPPSTARSRGPRDDAAAAIVETGPMRYDPDEFSTRALQNHDIKTFSHRVIESRDGHRLLAVGASWDLIASTDPFSQGLVDLVAVGDYLRTRAQCDGQGPVFSEKDVLDAVRICTISADDDLL